MGKTPHSPPLSIAVQVAGLHRLFPFGQTSWSRRHVRWHGEISPGEFSRTYTVEMFYELGSSPQVWVRKPNLEELAGERTLPHLYDYEAQELCLYVPGCGFWTPAKSIASTVMLWACLWLRLFELWLVTDVWHARGIHPRPKHKNRRERPSDALSDAV